MMCQQALKIVALTPGAGGMLCGSCLSDNTLIGAMQSLGHDASLVPLYTPITTDEENLSVPPVFFGGMNVYLQQKFPIFRHFPRFLDRLLDHPRLISLLTSLPANTNQDQLASLTLSMVRGEEGNQRKEVHRLIDWLAREPLPDIIHFSNLLVAGCARRLKREVTIPLVVTLQGDDVFLESLGENHRARIVDEMQNLVAVIDRFIVHSHFYAKKMASYFSIPQEKFSIVPLGIEAADYLDSPRENSDHRAMRVGYLARICPAKGLDLLVDAFLQLKEQPAFERLELWVAGDLSRGDRAYFDQQKARIVSAGCQNDFHYAGRVDRKQKIDFLSQLDLFSVPAPFEDPKGRYVLEALAAGIPVVQPADGAFPELIGRTGGGQLFTPRDSSALAGTLSELLHDSKRRRVLSREGREGVMRAAGATEMAEEMIAVYRLLLESP
ncbi:MAG: glycosyltransferase family 4 protein [Planctomycetota bacterium]|nr:glycosyltransferase family 4 protein [Planctomycetota bacterium]